MSCTGIAGEMSALNRKLTVERDDDLRYSVDIEFTYKYSLTSLSYHTGLGLIKLLGMNNKVLQRDKCICFYKNIPNIIIYL